MNNSLLWLEGTPGAASFTEELTGISEGYYGNELESFIFPPVTELVHMPRIGWSWWQPLPFKLATTKALRITFELNEYKTESGYARFFLVLRTYIEGLIEPTQDVNLTLFDIGPLSATEDIAVVDIDITTPINAAPNNNILEVVLFRAQYGAPGLDANLLRCHGCRTLTATEAAASIAAGTMRPF